MTGSRALGGAVAGTIGIVVLLGVVRLVAPVPGGLRPEDALPTLVAIALVLGSILARERAPTLAWLAVVAAGAVATIDLAVAARALRDVVEASTWRWLTVAIGIAALWTTGAAVAYAAGPGRRLGRWVPVVGATGIVLVAAAIAWAIAQSDEPSVGTGAIGPTGLVTRTFLVVTVGAVLRLITTLPPASGSSSSYSGSASTVSPVIATASPRYVNEAIHSDAR